MSRDHLCHPIQNFQRKLLEDCWSDPASKGNTLTCRTPLLLNKFRVPFSTWERPAPTHVGFIMDGVQRLRDFDTHQEIQSRLLYYPDPEFEQVSMSAAGLLEFKGNHLDRLNSADNFKIRLGNDDTCIIGFVAANKLTCDIPRSLLSNSTVGGSNISVEVIIGYSRHHIGEVTIGPGPPVSTKTTPLNSNWWILIGLSIVCLTVISFICIKCWKKAFLKPINEVNVSYLADITNAYIAKNLISSASTTAIVQNYTSEAQDEATENPPMETLLVDSATMALLEDKNLIIPRHYLVIGEKVGAGQFGCVYEGYLQRPEQTENIKIAIKTLRENSWSDTLTVESFLKEALIMRDFDHPNVLGLLGVCVEGSGPSIVLPFMDNGDLCSFVRDDTKVIAVSNLLKFAVDVASGMAYLGDKKFIHRDLAARNCILDSSLCVKVGDFGLSRDVYVDDYYHCENRNAKLPYRWMAPESLEGQIYSTRTDVWSYGVLLWELMTRGSVPYANVGNWDVLEYVKLGYRLHQPEYCPNSLYKAMLACWNKESKERPNFPFLHDFVSRIRQRLLDSKKNEAPSESVPALHTVYYNCRELYLRMDEHVLDKENVDDSFPVNSEYLDRNKEQML